ncbi:MAG: helix-turn-helix domain-containing protein [Gemmatimonadota bacterium]|nr:helix-turn-helix domain-containing protein [Gemmatimonadota bacterium]
MRREPDTTRVARVLLPLLLAITVTGILDLILDAPDDLLSAHVLVDIALVALSLGTALYLWFGFLVAERSLERTLDALEESSAERDAWRARTEELIRGLGAALEDVFEGWDLTPTERETALLLLKGHSHKRIARMTGRSERTVRQHAVSVYRKSGLGGRAALSGFFLDQLVLPGEEDDVPSGPVSAELGTA